MSDESEGVIDDGAGDRLSAMEPLLTVPEAAELMTRVGLRRIPAQALARVQERVDEEGQATPVHCIVLAASLGDDPDAVVVRARVVLELIPAGDGGDVTEPGWASELARQLAGEYGA